MKKVLAVLVIAVVLTRFPVVSAISTEPSNVVKGVVYWDQNKDSKLDKNEPGIPNVCVSNGREVVKTDSLGRYTLPAYDEMVIFVTKPADYDFHLNENNIPQFSYIHQPDGSPSEIKKYQGISPTGALPQSINFPLIKAHHSQNFNAIIMGDTQVYNDMEIGYLRDSVVKELTESDAAFALTLGDNVGDDLSLYPRLKSVLKGMNLPVFMVPGNHDLNFDSSDDAHSFDTFKREFGPTYYSFNYGKVHFIVLDSIYYPSPVFSSETRKTYHGEIDSQQIEWLRNDLSHVPYDHLVVLNMHIPLVSFVDRASSQHQIRNREQIYSILSGRKVLALAGHTHTTEQFLPGTMEDGWGQAIPFHEMIIGAACGSWWTGDFDENGIPYSFEKCGAPRGYMNFKFVGNSYESWFKATGKGNKEQMGLSFLSPSFQKWFDQLNAWLKENPQTRSTNPPVNLNDLPDQGILKVSELQDTTFVANVWNGRSDMEVFCRFDNAKPVKAIRSKTLCDPFALRQQLSVLRFSIGFKIFNSQYGPAAPQPLAGLLATSSTHIWGCPMPVDLKPGIHQVEVKVINHEGKQVYKDTKVFEVIGK